VTRRDATAAIGNHWRVVIDPHGGEGRPKYRRLQEKALRIKVGSTGDALGARDMSETRINGVGRPLIPISISRIDDHPRKMSDV
jgi:hypothetical protein